jgi:uncharacterized protein YndB with AHSA1/START domain
MSENKVVTAERVVHAPAAEIFELIADPARQPEWDGNDNLAEAEPGQRVHAVGDVFAVTLTKKDTLRPNRVVAFEEGRVIAWRPAPTGEPEPGHEWRWELIPVEGGTLVRHVYDWSNLTDPKRFERARNTTSDRLMASIDRLAALAEGRGDAV